MAEPVDLDALRRALGRDLAHYRRLGRLTQHQLAPKVNYTRSTIANVEVGRQPAPRAFWAECDEVLRADGQLVSAYDQIEAFRLDDRRTRIKAAKRTGPDISTATGDVGSPIDSLANLSIDTPVPRGIGWEDVDNVRFMTHSLALSENTYGGGSSGQAGAAQLQYSARLLRVRASNDVRSALYEAVGNLSGVVGFSAFDVADYQSARQCFEFELWCAEEAASWRLRACALGDMARLAMYLGHDDEALSLIEFSQVRSERLTARTQAMLCAVRARLLALQGREEEARSDVARSDEHFADRDPTQDPPWISYYDEAEHRGSTARALLPIAVRTRQLGLAVPRLRDAIRLHDDDHPRSRAFSRTRLASLMMRIGDPREAAAVGQVALAEASGVRSSRLRSELENLAALAGAHGKVVEAADLRHEIAVDSSRRIGAS